MLTPQVHEVLKLEANRSAAGKSLRSADAIALERVYRERAAIAAANRIRALRDHAYGSTDDVIPF